MSGRVAHAELEPADPEHVSPRERAVRLGEGLGPHPERRGLLGGVVVEDPIGGMEIHGRARVGLEARHAEHVVHVRVGDPDAHRRDAGGRQLVRDQPCFLPGVDDRAFPARLVDHQVAVLGEPAVRDGDDLHDATPALAFSRCAARYFSTAIAAVVASPTAVVIWRVSWLRTSPAANSPGIEVIMRSSVMKYPPASCLKWPSTSPEFGVKPMKTNTPPTNSWWRSPVTVSSSSRWSTPLSLPLISTTRLFQMTSIFGFANARSCRIFEARSASRRWTMYTLLA